MTHKLIETKHYLLVVDDSDMVGKGYRLDITRMSVGIIDDDFLYNARKDLFKKIIAHLPLNGSPILEGVDLLPPIEDDVEQLVEISSELQEGTYTIQHKITYKHGFKDGYNKAHENYKYTEDDVRKAIEMARELDGLHFKNGAAYKIIQSLHQYPTEFISDDEISHEGIGTYSTDLMDIGVSNLKPIKVPKTITNAQGIQWMGKYK